jgi:hypothetical protein
VPLAAHIQFLFPRRRIADCTLGDVDGLVAAVGGLIA